MFRKLISKPLSLSCRTPELKRFLCARDSVSPSSHTSQSLKSLQTLYSLSPNELMSLISLLRLSPSGYKKYLGYQAYQEKSELWLREYRLNKFYSAEESLEERQRTLSQKYPEVLKSMSGLTERQTALKDLEPVLFDGTARPGTVKGWGLKKTQEKLRNHLESLKATGGYSTAVEEAAEELLTSLQSDYSGKLVDMRVFFDSYAQPGAQSTHLAVKEKKPATKAPTALTAQDKSWTASGLTVKDLQELDELENFELRRFLAENNQQNLVENHAVALAEWVNDRKLVFQGPSLDFESPVFTARLLGLVGVLALGGFFYVVYKGDGKLVTLLALPVAFLLCSTYGSRQFRAARLNYLHKVWLHKDGKHLDLQVVSRKGLKVVKDVPINGFKIAREGPSVVNEVKAGVTKTSKKATVTLDQWRRNGTLVPGVYFETESVAGLVPAGGQNQRFAWENILKGVAFDTKEA